MIEQIVGWTQIIGQTLYQYSIAFVAITYGIKKLRGK